MDLLRFSTVGSVDDGKSTLIGRLLFDSRSIFEDQLAVLERDSLRRGHDGVSLALLTDGLRDERDQGITIDVAYRYFATPRRAFIIADTPGHFEFTRNMVTGASNADVAVVLVDVTRGVVEQSRRHAAIAVLLGLPNLVVCVNKMDLVGYAEDAFCRVREAFATFVTGLEDAEVTYVPMSALRGDNVVHRSTSMPWYRGPVLLEHLEAVPPASRPSHALGRLPVQLVISGELRHGGPTSLPEIAGRIESGAFRAGDEVTAMATGDRARIRRIASAGDPVDVAIPPMSVTVQLEPGLSLVRGDMLVTGEPPIAARHLEALLCWMAESPLTPGHAYTLKHTTRSVAAVCTAIEHRYDVNTHERHRPVLSLELNEIGLVEFRADEPLFVEHYRANRATGSFIVIDTASGATVAAGMVEAAD